MFFWWLGMPPLLGVLMFVGAIWWFARVWRSLRGWEDESLNQPAWQCEVPRCGAINPARGRFCRMCGQARR